MDIRKWWRTRRRRKNIDTLSTERYYWRSASKALRIACTELRLDPDNLLKQEIALSRKKYANYCISFGYDKAEEKLRILLAEELAKNPPCGEEQ